MIELPPPNQPPPPGSAEARGRRGSALLAVAVVLVLVLVVALVNGHRRDSAARQTADRVQHQLPSPSNRPTPKTGPTGAHGERLPLVACPQIRDEQSQLEYRCIEDGLRQDDSDTNLGLRIALAQEVEPGWVISEGSGNPLSLASPPSNDTVDFRQNRNAAGPALPSAQQVRDEVRRRTQLALERGYGDNPASRTMAAHARTFTGAQGFELVTEITMNHAYRAKRHLTARTERLWTVGVPTTAGVSIFMLSIPDNRADLWPKAEATVGTVHVL